LKKTNEYNLKRTQISQNTQIHTKNNAFIKKYTADYQQYIFMRITGCIENRR